MTAISGCMDTGRRNLQEHRPAAPVWFAPSIVPMQLHEAAQSTLGHAPRCIQCCNLAFTSRAAARAVLRAALVPCIEPIAPAPAAALCAVDGTHDVIETVGLTCIVRIALAVHDVTPVAQQTRMHRVFPLRTAISSPGICTHVWSLACSPPVCDTNPLRTSCWMAL